jgi:hypothetical protein
MPMSQTTKNIFGRSTLALSAFCFYVVNLAAVLLIGFNSHTWQSPINRFANQSRYKPTYFRASMLFGLSSFL